MDVLDGSIDRRRGSGCFGLNLGRYFVAWSCERDASFQSDFGEDLLLLLGLVGEDTALRVDRSSGNVSLADESHSDLVEALIAVQTVTDWLDDVERRLSAGTRTRLDDPASVQQQIASLQV